MLMIFLGVLIRFRYKSWLNIYDIILRNLFIAEEDGKEFERNILKGNSPVRSQHRIQCCGAAIITHPKFMEVHLSEWVNIVTQLQVGRSENLDLPLGSSGDFSLLRHNQTGSVSGRMHTGSCVTPPTLFVPRSLFLWVEWPVREYDHSPPSDAELKNTGSSISTPSYFFMTW
jgi:hypothetical protein